MLVDEFHLDEKRQGVIIEGETDDVLGRGNGVVVTSHLAALVEDRLEEDIVPHQLGLACVTDPGADFFPHVGDDNDILEGGVATEPSEHIEILRRCPAHPEIRDPVEVKDTCERVTSFVSARERRTT